MEGHSIDLGCNFRQLVIQTYKTKEKIISAETEQKQSKSAWLSLLVLYSKAKLSLFLPPPLTPLTLNISRTVYFTSSLFASQSQLHIVFSLPLDPVNF